MNRVVFLILTGVALFLGNCGSGGEADVKTTGDTAAAQAVVSGTEVIKGALLTKPSGVRYQEMVIGNGSEIVNGSYVEFDYSSWIADENGLNKLKLLGTSVGRPGQAFKGQVGVHPLPGLSEGLMGMKVGGSRRIYIPQSLGFKPGGPFVGQNLIFEVEGIKEVTDAEVTHYHDSVSRWLTMAKRYSDSLQQARRDSLAALGLDSFGYPLDSAAAAPGATGGH